MKLFNLKLENFQGLKAMSFNFDGKNASIFGDNGSGKTTVFNALTWLLFDKASTAAKNFTPKTKSASGDVHFLDHAVEGQFRLANGHVLTLRKVFREIYKKRRGSASEEFSGHTTDYYVQKVPATEREYLSTVLTLLGSDLEQAKILAMPGYFAEEMTNKKLLRIEQEQVIKNWLEKFGQEILVEGGKKMLNFDNLELIAEATFGLRKVAVYRCPTGLYYLHGDNKTREVWPADVITWYNKIHNLQEWGMQMTTKETEEGEEKC